MNLGIRSEGAASLMIEPGLPPFDKEAQMRTITKLRTAPEARRKGDARWLLCEVMVEADKERTVLVLEPKPDEGGPLDVEELELWYRRFGFRVVQREPITLMVRPPR